MSDTYKSNIFNIQNSEKSKDYTVKQYADSKTELASKKTASVVVLGNDKQEVINE